MRVHSYTIVHYGKSYLGYAIKSINPIVDQSHIIYTKTPSHGHQPDISPIESLSQIQKSVYAQRAECQWYEMKGVRYEGRQRDEAVDLCKHFGADLILVLDYDEIWHEDVLAAALKYVWEKNKHRNWLINFTHLWKSFNWCCKDQGWPVRIIDTRHSDGTGYIPIELGEIFHFGYAIKNSVLEYKMQIHGHKNEFRANWYQDKWKNWTPGIKDVHPTNGEGFWNPEPFDKEKLPELMKSHPFWGLERIE